MTLKKLRGRDNVYGLQDSVNRLFDSFFGREGNQGTDFTNSWYPLTNIYENKDGYRVVMDVPGLTNDDLNIEFKESSIIISGERKEDLKIKDETCHMAETPFGRFSRTFMLPNSIDPKKIDASLKNGVLEIKIAKAETAKPKSIKISVE